MPGGTVRTDRRRGLSIAVVFGETYLAAVSRVGSRNASERLSLEAAWDRGDSVWIARVVVAGPERGSFSRYRGPIHDPGFRRRDDHFGGRNDGAWNDASQSAV